MERILVGSTYFFSCYEDFVSKDIDEIEIIDTNSFRFSRQLTGRGRCLFQFKRLDCAQDYINQAKESTLGMVIGKFLVPEFCKAIDMDITQLKQLQPLIAKLDDKHKYEEIIFNSYLENNAFYLTEEQRLMAYRIYKEERGE